MSEKERMNAAEYGALWMTYQKKTMIVRMLEYFIEKAVDDEARTLMTELHQNLVPKIVEIRDLFENEGASPPIGFTEKDVYKGAANLYENGFDIMFCRILKEISMGMYTLHLTMSYRADIIKLYQDLIKITQDYYGKFTQYLQDKRILPVPTYMLMPHTAEYLTDKNYLKGNLFGDKRPLSAMEFGYLYHAVEINMIGLKLMAGFSQSASEEAVKAYFDSGKELTKKILLTASEVLNKNDIQPPASPGCTLTNSTEAPFSGKLMMFCTYLLCNFSIGAQGFGAGFSLRNDLNVKFGKLGIESYRFMKKGVNLMIEKGWLEEPPQMKSSNL